MSAFERELGAKRWEAAKNAAQALPEPARVEAMARLTKSANAQLVATMKQARELFAAGDYQAAATVLARDIPVAPYADPQVREAFVKLARTVRDAAREAANRP